MIEEIIVRQKRANLERFAERQRLLKVLGANTPWEFRLAWPSF